MTTDNKLVRRWRDNSRLGINHHLLFPASFDSADVHLATLPVPLGMEVFSIVDCMIPDARHEEQAVALIRASGKEAIYNCPLMTGPGLNPHGADESARARAEAEVRRHIDRAKRLGSRRMVVASGADPGPSLRAEETERFVSYMQRLCAYAGPELTLMIEPFDRSIGKNLLIGPTREAVSVVEEVRAAGFANVGILMDMGHVPLMEETFRHAVATAGSLIRHVHLGSCVKRDPADPLYGDMHPPWGYPGGENDVAETVEFLRCLGESGYFDGAEPASLTLEMRPYPGVSEPDSVAAMLRKLDEAWEALARG